MFFQTSCKGPGPEHDVHDPGLVVPVLLVMMEAAELVSKCLQQLISLKKI